MLKHLVLQSTEKVFTNSHSMTLSSDTNNGIYLKISCDDIITARI